MQHQTIFIAELGIMAETILITCKGRAEEPLNVSFEILLRAIEIFQLHALLDTGWNCPQLLCCTCTTAVWIGACMWSLAARIGGTIQNVDPKVLFQYYPSIIFKLDQEDMCFFRLEDRVRSSDLILLHQCTEERVVVNQERLLLWLFFEVIQ